METVENAESLDTTASLAPGLIVAGGGTGGHVLAGIAIADAWKAKYPGAHILFVGARGGIEEKLVPRAGYPLVTLTLGSLKGVSWKKRMKTFAQLPFAIAKSLSVLITHRPRAVVGVGGYASGPLVLCARLVGMGWGFLWRSRVGILEQNAVPGFTNRVLGVFANVILTAFPGIEDQFPSHKVQVSGNPVRAILKPMTPATRNPFTIFIFGGSQGAQGINTLVLDAVPHLKDLNVALKFIHQTGEKDFERVKDGHAKLGTDARVEKFIYEMPEAYAASSLVICRSGSSTLAELAAVGRAAILVPFPHASDNHQEKNALLFADAGAAVLLRQTDSKGEDLARLIREFVTSQDRLSKMEQNIKGFYRPHAAEEVVKALS